MAAVRALPASAGFVQPRRDVRPAGPGCFGSTGEIEITGDDISGIGVHVAARVASHAEDRQIRVSGVVPLLMAGSSVQFEPRGEWTLKGVPGEWPLFAVKT
jgi:class 3 adenylate cyclase